MFYVYLLKDKGISFYVGKGTKGRMYDHANRAKSTDINRPVLNKIRKMFREGRKVQYEVIFESLSSEEALVEEIIQIASIGRRDLKKGSLLNLTDGGEGVKGYTWTEGHRKHLSDSIKRAIGDGRFAPGTFDRTDAYKSTMSKASRDFWEHNPKSDDVKREISRKLKGRLVNGKRKLSKEARRKMSEAATRGNMERGDDVKKKISEGMKKVWEKRKKSS